MRRLILLAALLGSVAHAYNSQAPIFPDPTLTPGDVLTTDPKVICVPGYTQTVRNVPQAVKEQAYREYGITSREPGEYEVDHLISLELGGSNSLKNLWPESFQTQPLNAHVKDKIENALHDLACNGQITFQQAQEAIATNWEQAYRDYLGPLPGGASVEQPTGGNSSGTTHQKLSSPATGGTPTSSASAVSRTQRHSAPTPTTTSQPIPATPASKTAKSSTKSVTPLADGECPATAPVKISRSGIYHLPTADGNYNTTKAVACFKTAQAAQAAGYRGTK